MAFAAGRSIVFQIAAPADIDLAIQQGYSEPGLDAALRTAIAAHQSNEAGLADGDGADSAPVVQLVNQIFTDGVRAGASDIHIEPGARSATVRFRVDGIMRLHLEAPLEIVSRLVSRIKVMAKLDIAQRMRPQDGRARLTVDGQAIDLRVSTVPTRSAEKAVIRLLKPGTNQTLEDIGIPSEELIALRSLMRQRDGIVIVTGPTGSGKTTTLYAALREIATGDVNVMTVEDPIEYEVSGITQMQVDTKRGVTFASALRAILRQDPDVIFLGEIRDLETAVIAVQASMTGHLVLATLHANDALGAVARLLDLGLDRASISATLRGAIAQRLVRRICQDCSAPVAPGTMTAEERRLAERYQQEPKVRAVGCTHCGGSGYRGRIPLDEVVTMNAELTGLVGSGASIPELQQAAVRTGMRSLREVALRAADTGTTTLAEIERVLGETGDEPRGRTPVAAPIPTIAPLRSFSPPTVPVGGVKPTILVVDDDPVQRRMCETVLTQRGYDVVTATDGEHAAGLLGTPGLSLVLTDLHMPRMDGAQLVHRVRSAGPNPTIPIVVLTGSSNSAEDEIRLMDLGADDYLRKPIDPPRLATRVAAALRRAGG